MVYRGSRILDMHPWVKCISCCDVLKQENLVSCGYCNLDVIGEKRGHVTIYLLTTSAGVSCRSKKVTGDQNK